jgi:isoquinoline 1-oxidoreductase beta subunit
MCAHRMLSERCFTFPTRRRMNQIPEIFIEVVPTNNHPTGVGQMATPLVAPAIANAVIELTGVRLRHAPMTPNRVLSALRT